MRKPFVLAALVGAVALPSVSHAQYQLGVRLGYGVATGDAYRDPVDGTAVKMSDGLSSQIPLQLDVMYAVTPEIEVGAYVSYGFAQLGGDVKTSCDAPGADCSTSEYRVGVQGTYAFTKVSPTFVPWAGLGIGYEWSGYTGERGGVKTEKSFHGFEFAILQVGGDYELAPKFSVGPYLTYGFAQYSGGEQTVTGSGAFDGTVPFADFADTAIHQWWSVGIAGKYDL